MVFLPTSRQAGTSFAKRDSGSSTPGVVIGVVIGVVALIIVFGVLWYFWRHRRPKRVQHVRARPRLDDGDRPKQTLIEDFASPKMSMNGGRPGGIESWLQGTQLASGPGRDDFPRSPGRKPEETFVPPTPPSPPPASLRRAPRPSHDRSPSTHSLLAQAAASAPALPPTPASAPAAVGQTPDAHPSHARPLAFLKAVFSSPEDESEDGVTTPTVARLPLMAPPPTRPQRSPSLALTQSAYGTELTPADAPDSGQQRTPQRNRSLTSMSPPPVPAVPKSATLSGAHSRRQSFSAASSQGGLPLPSFYLPSDAGGERDQPAIPIGESVLGVSPVERRQSQSSRRGRTRGSHFVVVNAAEDD